MIADGNGGKRLQINSSQTACIARPATSRNPYAGQITWVTPEGGSGPNYQSLLKFPRRAGGLASSVNRASGSRSAARRLEFDRSQLDACPLARSPERESSGSSRSVGEKTAHATCAGAGAGGGGATRLLLSGAAVGRGKPC